MKLIALTLALAGARVCEKWELDDFNFRRGSGPPFHQSAPACSPSSPTMLRRGQNAPIHLHNLLRRDASVPNIEGFATDVVTQPEIVQNVVDDSHESEAAPHLVHLSVVQSFEDWCKHPCMQSTWEIASPKPSKKNSSYKLYEAAIWRQEDPPRLALYEFDDKFAKRASNSWEICNGEWECMTYYILREHYNILDIKLEGDDISVDLKNGFKKVFDFIAERSNDEMIKMITYSGHGASGSGAWFEGALKTKHAQDLFLNTKYLIQWDVINFGTNCEEGQWNMLEKMHPFAKYIVASDLNVGGWGDGGKLSDHDERMLVRAHTEWDQMVKIKEGAEQTESVEDILHSMLEGRKELWNHLESTKENKHRQSISVYRTSEVLPFRNTMRTAYADFKKKHNTTALNAFHGALEYERCDALAAVKALDPDGVSETRFYALRKNYTSTATNFPWRHPCSHGLKFNWVEDFDDGPPCQVGAFFNDADRINVEEEYLRSHKRPPTA